MAQLNTQWLVQPHEALTEIGDGIWTVEGTVKMPLGRFPRRMTIIALAGGGLAIWSPISVDSEQTRRIEKLGEIRFLIVPNAGHRLDIGAWKARYPAAKVIAPPNARAQVAEAAPVDATYDIIRDPRLRFELVAGTKADEFALLITRDDGKTLVLNDILSSIRRPRGIGANVMARLLGFGIRHPRTSRPVRRLFVTDPAALAGQFRTWARLPDIRRLVVSHVDVIEHDPSAALEGAARDLAF